MKVLTSDYPIEKLAADVLVIPVFENGEKVEELIKQHIPNIPNFKLNQFNAKVFETFLIPATEVNCAILLIGAGKKENFDNRVAQNVAGAAMRKLLSSKIKRLVFDASIYTNPEVIIVGVGLAEFESGIYKTGKKNPEKLAELIINSKIPLEKIKKSLSLVEATNWARNLVFQPANKLTPKNFVEEAKKIAKEGKLQIEVIDEKEAARRGMGAFVGIAQGSHEPAFMVVLKYFYKKEANTLAAVGKGITFDSGGISIKPSEKMHEMKMDMAGAAAAVGFMKLVAELKPKVNVVSITPLTENLPGGGALKPGDVVKAMNGKTIEVLNTDAEGRVVLSDALVYAQKLGATKIVDLATLTGAVIVALGSEATAILGNKQDFTNEVITAGEKAGERMWQLPLYIEHKELLRSEIADLANIPPSRGSGVIAGAVFLQEFIEPKNSWVHLDIAGTAWLDGEKPYLAKGATGVGIHTLLKLLEGLS